MLKLLTIADAFSLLNASFGFLAIFSILFDEQRLSFSFIFLALLADGLDGIIARRWGGGKMGEPLEAMADMLSLSIAPLLFGLWFAIRVYSVDHIVIVFSLSVGFVFLICSAIRLASFRVLKDQSFFVGLPASVSTILIVGFAYLHVDILVYLIIILVLSVAMISSIKFPKPSIHMNIVASMLIVLTLGLYTTFSNISIILLLIAMFFYSIVGPVYLIKSSRK